MSNIIEFKNVSKTYDDNTVLKDFNLNIEKGEFLTVIGTSGSGKTTMLKMINSLIEPSGGDIFVNGINNKDVDKIKLRRNIGYAIQGSVLFPNMNVEKNTFNIYFQKKTSMNSNFKELINEHELKLSKIIDLMLYGIADKE